MPDSITSVRFSSPPLPKWVRWVVVLSLFALFVGVGVSTVYRAAFGPRERSDFTVYQAAGQAVLEGTNIYDAHNVRGWYFTALPAFALVSVPFGMLSKAVGSGVWYLICLAALLHGAWLAARLGESASGPTRVGRAGIALGALTLTAWPWLSGLSRGQASVLLAWLVIVAVELFLVYRKRLGPLFIGGFALAGAIILKAFPALLIGWLMLRRQWLATVASLVALAILLLPVPALVFGWDGNLHLLKRWVTSVALPLGDATREEHHRYEQMLDPRIDKNQSLQAVMVRIAAPHEEQGEHDRRETIARGVAMVISLSLLAITAGACWRSGRRRDENEPEALQVDVRQASAVILLSLFIAPLTWSHYYTVALLPAAVAVAMGLSSTGAGPWPRRYRVAMIVWLVGFIGAVFEPVYHVGGHLVAGLALWTVLVWQLWTDEIAEEVIEK